VAAIVRQRDATASRYLSARPGFTVAISWMTARPCTRRSIVSSRVGLHGAGSRIRSKPPERYFVASVHHFLSFGSCPDARVYCFSRICAQWSQPRISQRLMTVGHVPVDPLCCQVPTSGEPPSVRSVPSLPVCAL